MALPSKAPLSEPQLCEFANKSVSNILLYSTTVNCNIKREKKAVGSKTSFINSA